MSTDTLVSLPVAEPVWDHFHLVSSLVLIGTLEADGTYDLAPKHMAMPMSWENWFGFVCTPRHRTWQNAVRSKVFTVSYPTSEQILLASLAAAPRCGDDKPALQALQVGPAREVEGVLVDGCDVYLECRLDRTVDDLGANSLVLGRVVAAHVRERALRGPDIDDSDLVRDRDLLAFVQPDRFTRIDTSHHFPYHAGWKR